MDSLIFFKTSTMSVCTIKSMIMTGKHPKGVEPKWPDAKMAPLPHLKEHIPDLHEYLKTFK